MRDDEGFEIDRAFDLLPHVVGASWATIWFRMNRIQRPTAVEFRNKVAEYYKMLDPLVESYAKDEKLADMVRHVRMLYQKEMERILNGKNEEIEKRFKRYLDYG
ncbi:MAG: hypothetical protein KGI27_12060 [Thaumarchaeota archaeon]|nr:hypothetical protein [Nitrososphaerota archaeon]